MGANVTVVLPDGRRGPAEIDPLASIDEVKKTIISDLQLGEPKDFKLAFSYQAEGLLTGEPRLQDGDIIFVMESQATRGVPPAKLDANKFVKP